ncbi:hypothetical protein CR194_15900 [Salipaludibacillus keqinensis]|uniref:Uncharacterized protein n=1 Tax=Salipaludibacillus keqinensis TaxID=2045207 RepID=A0A323TCE1_9BACI|nr:bifunctional adenosylcobinamide kinase/adenosylcobinamide-phosphate guanylyltransferase [Salipaludibacillus keqinensis]PYZ92316.1 hypothetical protein CR194_15900 [Salipaludibacillus keqinensis]
MQLIIGGAFSGKRKIVKNLSGNVSWISSYEQQSLSNWEKVWEIDSNLVLEGWENWLRTEIQSGRSIAAIRQQMNTLFAELKAEEKRRDQQVILIMLEMGRGIVPLEEENRQLRDLTGWIQQDAAEISEKVIYVWHGLTRVMK